MSQNVHSAKTPFSLKCQNSEEKVKVYQSELTKAPYQKRDKKSGKLKDKISKKTEKTSDILRTLY